MRAAIPGVAVAAKARQSMGWPQKSASSLFVPNRRLSPEAMITQPTVSDFFIQKHSFSSIL